MNGRKIFWKQLQILGTTMGTPDEFKALVDFVNRHRIIPVIDEVFPLADAEKAVKKMETSLQFGKIILTV